MRIRLRVPKDGEVKSEGSGGWFQRFRDSFLGPAASHAVPKILQCKTDKRWSARGDSKYYLEGRHCRRIDGDWQSEYVFSVLAKNELQKIRVVVPEGPVAQWEREHDQRMSEEQRLQLARETMESLVDLQRFPDAITVPSETIAATSKV
jgi:hypothetical protein